jgi:hypothetical protein
MEPDSTAKIAIIVITVVVGAINITILYWMLARPRHILDKWADKNHYRILERTLVRPWYLLLFAFSCGIVVYRVRVETEQGEQKVGWVRCGSLLWGVRSDKAVVTWE